MITKDEAARQCKEIVKAFCEELGIEMPKLRNDDLWGVFEKAKWNGHALSFAAFYRYKGQKGFGWGDVRSHRNEVTITYKDREVAHPDCPYCEEIIAIVRHTFNPEDARIFAEKIKQGRWK